MTYDDQKQKMGREPVHYVEIFFTRCQLTYGIAPCTAAIGVTGPQKCFNTFGSCQDTANFDPTNLIPLRFSTLRIDGLQQPGDAPTIPTLISVGLAPTSLTPGKGLGARSAISIRIQDMPWTDVFTDPYVEERTYEPLDRSTFWRRQLARDPFYEGRTIKVYTGFLDDDGGYDAANFKSRTFFIEGISGPTTDGMVSITAKDPLKRADFNRAQWPRASSNTLLANIDSVQTAIALQVGQGANFTALTYIRINDEVMFIDSIVVDVLNVTRATLPLFYSELPIADEHDAGDTVQDCILYDTVRVDDVLFDLLTVAAEIPASLIDVAAWTGLADEWLANHFYSRLIIEPTPVKDLLDEITRQLPLLWWDERDQLIDLDVIRPVPRGTVVGWNDDANIKAGRVGINRDKNSRISQFWLYFGVRSPLLDLTLLQNYRNITVEIDAEAEDPNAYGTPRIDSVFSQWIPSTGADIALEIAGRMLNFYDDSKIILVVTVDQKDDDQWTGDQVEVTTRYLTDQFGEAYPQRFMVIEVKENIKPTGTDFSYTLMDMGKSRVGVITPNDNPEFPADPFPDYLDASDDLKANYAFISNDLDPATMTNGDPAYTIA